MGRAKEMIEAALLYKAPCHRSGKGTSGSSMIEGERCGGTSPEPATAGKFYILGNWTVFEKCFLSKSEWMFDERLKMHVYTVSDTLHGTYLLSLYLIWGQAQDLLVRAPTPGLLPDLNVLIFSLFSLPFNGEYAKKAHHIYSMFLTSFHRHLDPTWQKIGSLIWSSRVRCMCSSISSSPFSLAPTY